MQSLLDTDLAVTAPGERGGSGLGKTAIINIPCSGTACHNDVDGRAALVGPPSLGNLASEIIRQLFLCRGKPGEIVNGKSVKARPVKRFYSRSG